MDKNQFGLYSYKNYTSFIWKIRQFNKEEKSISKLMNRLQVLFTSPQFILIVIFIQYLSNRYRLQQHSIDQKMQSAIEKVIMYGVVNPQKLKLTQVLSNKIKVQTLQFYSSPTSENVQYLQKIDLEMWAYPDGIKIYNDRYQILNDNQPQFSFFDQNDLLQIPNSSNSQQNKQPPQYIYSFVLTNYELTRTYCTCMIWNERYFIKDDRAEIANSKDLNISPDLQKVFKTPKQPYSLAIPKCRLETMINNPLILDANTYLVYVPKAMIACSKTPCLQLQRSLLKYYYANVLMQEKGKQNKVIKIPRLFEYELNNLIKNYGYPKAESIFDNQKSETIRNIQMMLLKNSMKDIQKDKFSGVLSVQTNKLQQFYISSLFVLPYDHKNSHILTENGIRIGSKLKSDTVFHLPKIYDMFSEYFQNSNSPPLLPLPIPQFIQLWKCLLLQKQIILFSNSQYKSILLSEFMLYLIQPIKWQNIYIPFLPFHLAHHIDAIGGYLIGMSRIHMDYMLDKFDMKSKVVVDLDHQTILEEGGKQVIQLPEEIQSYIQTQLKNILLAYDQSRKPTRSFINYLITSPPQQSGIKQKIQAKQNFIKYSLQIQKTFFHALVDLFNNFIPFITKKQDGIIAVKTQQYLNILSNKLHRDFMKQISKTMVFIRLCEYHVQESERCAWVQRTIGELFVYSHDILSHKYLVNKTQEPKNDQPATKQKVNNYNENVLRLKESESDKPITAKSNQKSKRAYAWRIQDLLLKQQKYNQYIEYLFDKNLKEIINTITTTQAYLNQQQKKYGILMSQDQFQSFQSLKSIEIPLNFGKKNNKSSPLVNRRDKDQEVKNIYQQIHSQEMKSKKWKKYGEKDEEDLYQQFSRQCNEHKIDKFIIKYLKYLELYYPEVLLKVNAKQHKSQKNKNGIFNWLWDLVNPPDSSRMKQQSQIKTKLKKRITVKHFAINEIVNLKSMFAIKNNQQEQINEKNTKNVKQNQQNKLKPKQLKQKFVNKTKGKRKGKQQEQGQGQQQQFQGENSDLQQNLFKNDLKIDSEGKRASRTQSDIVVFNTKTSKKN